MKPPEPQYVQDIRDRNPGREITRVEVERQILREWRTEWSRDMRRGPWGHTFTGHLIAYTCHAFPRLDMNPWLRRMLSSFEFTYYKQRRKICNFIGCQNSGKTDYFATFAMVMLSIRPECTKIYAASPYESAAQSGMWGRIQKRNADGERTGCSGKYISSKEKIVLRELPEAGMVELRPIDKVGKLQGTKQADPEWGWFILFCDEIALFPTKDLLELLANLRGNERFFCYTGCNFKSIHDLAGVLCKPEDREFSSLEADRDHRWLSGLGSVTYRFDGHRSPNIVAKKVLYKYLMKEEDRRQLELDYGLTGPKYLEQARSFPFSSLAEFFVTTWEEVKSYSGTQDVIWAGPTERVAFCDAAFGGGDPCKFGIYEFGMARCEDSEGKWHNRQVFRPVTQHITIPIAVGMPLTKAWADRVKALTPSGKYQFQELGTKVSADQQVAVLCGETLREWNIPFSNFGFDGSMRSEFTQEVITILGNDVIALDFGGTPTDRPGDALGNPAKDLYTTFVAELYFSFGHLVRAGQFRSANTVTKAVSQAVKRWWRWRGNKKGIQPKGNLGKADDKIGTEPGDTRQKLKSYKDQHGESPDDADTLVGAIEIAKRKGLCLESSRVKSVTDEQAAKAAGQSSVAMAAALNAMLRPKPRSLNPVN